MYKALVWIRNILVDFYKQNRARFLRTGTFRSVGDAQWLISTEEKYGGFVKNVPVHEISRYDNRDLKIVEQHGMQGGDRMAYHGYATHYANAFSRYLPSYPSKLVVLEIGILKGTGLAIWCDLFPTSKVIGLDIDLKNINDNYADLKMNGAFQYNSPVLANFDQLKPEVHELQKILEIDKITICIDDGLHSNGAVEKTFRALQPFLAEDFTYIVEDYIDKYNTLKNLAYEYGYELQRYGQFNIITKKD